ncbi:DUF4428 domain-containing protein, partial [Enterococcus faecium]|uniref:DUF4428 domain-containing protein n=1 Tax=Enterococcus faecium TaxID=1352 RepID=UPI001EDD4A12
MSKQCAKCGGKIGLTSYKIKDKQIVCGNCMKKAGYGMTTPYKIIRSLNLEDLDKYPSEKRKLNWNGNSFFDKFYKVQNFFP